MNARSLALTSITLLGIPFAHAQDSTPPNTTHKSTQSTHRLANPHRTKSNEVTAVLDPIGVPPTAQPSPPTAQPSPPTAVEPPTQATTTPPQGLAVHVEKLQIGSGFIDSSQVKLLAPFPAKPLTPAPAGWTYQTTPTAPTITRELELSPGNKITLTVRPHLLVPDADGASVFSVPEPGFDAALGYRQTSTVGAILAHSIHQLDHDAKELGSTIDQLQQILLSLPKPPPTPDPSAAPLPTPAPPLKPTRKR